MELAVFFLVFMYLFVVQLSFVVKLIYCFPPFPGFLLEMIPLNLSFARAAIEKKQNKTSEGGNPKPSPVLSFCSWHIAPKGCAFTGSALGNSFKLPFLQV